MNFSESDFAANVQQSKTPAYAHVSVLGCWLLLFVIVWWRQLTQGIDIGNIGWAMIYSLPLLAPLPGLLSNKRYTHTWATLCVLPYFIVGITESVANGKLRYWAISLLGASLLWFFALITYLRVTKQKR